MGGMLTLYRGLGSGKLMKGLYPFTKFTIVKALVLFIVINNLLFFNLIEDGKIAVPKYFTANLDPNSDNYDDEKSHRLVSFIFQIETFILMILSLWSFRPSDMDIFDDGLEDRPAHERQFCYFVKTIFHFTDFFKLVKPPQEKLDSGDISTTEHTSIEVESPKTVNA